MWRVAAGTAHTSAPADAPLRRAGTRKDLLTCARLLQLAPGRGTRTALMARLRGGVSGPLAGRVAGRVGQGDGPRRRRLRSRCGCARASRGGGRGPRAASPMRRPTAPNGCQYAQILGEVQQPRCVPVLLRVVEKSRDDGVRMAALTALQSYPDPTIGVRGGARLQAVAARMCATRRPCWPAARRGRWSWLEAVAAGKIDACGGAGRRGSQAFAHEDTQLRGQVAKHWGKVEGATTAEMQSGDRTAEKVILRRLGQPLRRQEAVTRELRQVPYAVRPGRPGRART